MPNNTDPEVRIQPHGPYLVSRTRLFRMRQISNPAGRPMEWARGAEIEFQGTCALCRCGASENKPFCDGRHKKVGFDGAELADRTPTSERREHYFGDGIVLTDDKPFCYHAGFCVTEHTNVWDLIDESSDPAAREEIVRMVRACPSGRLEFQNPPNKEPVEEELDAEIAVVEDGPLWVRGRVPVEAEDGKPLEVRNRMALCRCGASANKPYCDGTHAAISFRDC